MYCIFLSSKVTKIRVAFLLQFIICAHNGVIKEKLLNSVGKLRTIWKHRTHQQFTLTLLNTLPRTMSHCYQQTIRSVANCIKLFYIANKLQEKEKVSALRTWTLTNSLKRDSVTSFVRFIRGWTRQIINNLLLREPFIFLRHPVVEQWFMSLIEPN